MSENFAELLEESLSHSVMKPGAVIEAEVVDISADFIIVNAGLKSEAEIPVNQFKDAAGNLDIAVGEKVEVAIEVVEDGFGNTRLSRERARRARSWEMLEKAFEEQSIVTGNMTGTVKGGFTVAIEGVRAFLPGSLVDVRPISDMAYLENKELEFKVIKLDQVRNNVVVSRRAVVEKEMEAERKQLLENIEEGQVIRGVVKNLTDYGAFVNLGGLDGLLHITDISWSRINHPSEALSIGEQIKVIVTKFDKEEGKVSLGIKQLSHDPWQGIENKFPLNTSVMGKVTNLTDYGFFAEIDSGVEGLVHVSEIDWTNKNIHPSKVVKLGDSLEVMILEVDEEKRRISLGMKQLTENPWQVFTHKHKEGDKINGTIKSITDFGIFIGLDGGIDGLVHLSDLSWEDTGEEAVRNYKKGDTIEAVVLSVDAERERISLGIKQLDQDPFSVYVAENPKGSTVKGVVSSIDSKGISINLADGVEGHMRAVELSRDFPGDTPSALQVENEIEAKITSIERKSRRITLSAKALETELEGQAIKEYATRESGVTTTLGEKLKEQLSRHEDDEDEEDSD